MSNVFPHLPQKTPLQQREEIVRSELAAIVASDVFSSSKRCCDFLEFVVDHTLAGDYRTLTERSIGVELFGRPVDYETGTDSIVRVRANDVRRRLAEYYAGCGATSLVRIDLVTGGYTPEFHWQAKSDQSAEGAVSEVQRPDQAVAFPDIEPKGGGTVREAGLVTKRNIPTLRQLFLSVVIILIGFGLFVAAFHLRQSNFDRFWWPVFTATSVPILNLPTTDTLSLTVPAQHSRQLSPDETVTLGAKDVLIYHNWHESLPVIRATLALASTFERQGKTPLIRIGTEMSRDELEGHPIVAIGSFSNPWTQQSVSGLRFTFDRGTSDLDIPRIRDNSNPNRTWTLEHLYPDSQTKDFAIVTRMFDPVTRTPFISLAGLHSFGNQIAGEFVVKKSSWDEVAARAPSGWEKMNLQVVLVADVVGTTPGSPQIVEVYFWN